MKQHKYTKWKLTARLANYVKRNNKLSPLYQKEYLFLKHLYWYLTRQDQGKDFRKELYEEYINLINICYFPNKEDFSLDWAEVIYYQCNILIDREYQSPITFIMLNDSRHYLKLKQTVELIYNWSQNPLYCGYASEKEFYKDIDFLRKQFSKDKIDMYEAVGKWPRKFRKRFARANKHKG